MQGGSKSLRLAIFSPGFAPVPNVKGGAIEQLITNIVEANEADGTFCIDLYTMDDPLLDNIKLKKTELIRVNNSNQALTIFCQKLKNKLLDVIGKDRINFIEINMLNRYKKNYYDIVLVENNMNLYRRVLKKITNEKIYFHLHNDFNNGDPSKTLKKTKLIIKTADGILVVSNFLKNKLVQLGAKKVYVVPNMVNIKSFHSATSKEDSNIKKKYNIEKKNFVFLYVGRLSEDKGIDKLLLAMDHLSNYSNIKCLIIGNNFFNTSAESSYIRYLKKIAGNIKHNIIFTGYINNEDLYRFYSISNCVVIPSQCEEAFGMVALEAMLMKKPIIASKAGGLTEVVSSNGSILINRNSFFVKNLISAMKKMINSPNLCNEMGENNYIKAESYPLSSAEYFKLAKGVIC